MSRVGGSSLKYSITFRELLLHVTFFNFCWIYHEKRTFKLVTFVVTNPVTWQNVTKSDKEISTQSSRFRAQLFVKIPCFANGWNNLQWMLCNPGVEGGFFIPTADWICPSRLSAQRQNQEHPVFLMFKGQSLCGIKKHPVTESCPRRVDLLRPQHAWTTICETSSLTGFTPSNSWANGSEGTVSRRQGNFCSVRL